MESKPNFAKVHGPWWTQIKVVLIQKGLLDNQNPGFCMGWPGLYLLLDNIDQLGTVCHLNFALNFSDDSKMRSHKSSKVTRDETRRAANDVNNRHT